jgi:sigma-B regulation protein RsbU (phosphoserine phosphatase)
VTIPTFRRSATPTTLREAAMRVRVEALVRLSMLLSGVRSERELAAALGEGLRGVFGARQIGLYVRSPSTRQLVPAPGTPGDALLRLVCMVAPGLPEPLRIAPRGPELLGALATPGMAPEDGVRGPLLWAPLADAGGMLGLLAIEAEPRGRGFGDDDRTAFVSVAAQTCLTISRLRAERITAEERASPHDLLRASQVQRRLLPELPRRLGPFLISVEYSPAYHVGGDFYDAVEHAPGVISSIIGDVAGKGVSAALMMARLGVECRRRLQAGVAPRELLAEMNRALCLLLPDDSFATAAAMRLDSVAGTLTIANAGHVLPVVKRAAGGVLPIGRQAGMALGMLADETYTEQTLPLAKGDIVILMTDGVVEALDRDPRNMWQLLDLIVQAPHDVGAISYAILQAVERQLGARRADDVTLLSFMLE